MKVKLVSRSISTIRPCRVWRHHTAPPPPVGGDGADVFRPRVYGDGDQRSRHGGPEEHRAAAREAGRGGRGAVVLPAQVPMQRERLEREREERRRDLVTQRLGGTAAVSDDQSSVDGCVRARPAARGRCGVVCVWREIAISSPHQNANRVWDGRTVRANRWHWQNALGQRRCCWRRDLLRGEGAGVGQGGWDLLAR